MAGQTIPPSSGGTAIGWYEERKARALYLLPNLVDRFTSTDLNDGNYTLGSNTAADATRSGGWRTVPNAAATGTVYLGGSQQIQIFAPKTEPWYLSGEFVFPQAAFTAAKFIVPIGFSDASGNNALYVQAVPATSTTVWQLNQYASGDNLTSCGAVGTLGASTNPVGSPCRIEMYYTGSALTVGFNDTASSAASLSGASLATMVTGAVYPLSFANDNTMAMRVNAMFLAWKNPTS